MPMTDYITDLKSVHDQAMRILQVLNLDLLNTYLHGNFNLRCLDTTPIVAAMCLPILGLRNSLLFVALK